MASMNLSTVRGDDETYEVMLTDKDGDPLSVVGADIWFTAKRHLEDPDDLAVFQKTVGDGIEINSDDGSVTLTIDSADTAFLPPFATRLYYDVQVEIDGSVITPLRGRLVVRPDVTNGAGS